MPRVIRLNPGTPIKWPRHKIHFTSLIPPLPFFRTLFLFSGVLGHIRSPFTLTTITMAVTSKDGVTTIKQNEVIIPDLTIKDLLSAIP